MNSTINEVHHKLFSIQMLLNALEKDIVHIKNKNEEVENLLGQFATSNINRIRTLLGEINEEIESAKKRFENIRILAEQLKNNEKRILEREKNDVATSASFKLFGGSTSFLGGAMFAGATIATGGALLEQV